MTGGVNRQALLFKTAGNPGIRVMMVEDNLDPRLRVYSLVSQLDRRYNVRLSGSDLVALTSWWGEENFRMPGMRRKKG